MTRDKILKAIQLVCESQEEIVNKVESMDEKIANLEKVTMSQAEEINKLQQSVDSLRDSAIRGEIASGRRSKDVAADYNLSPARITQIAPRSNFKH